MEMMTSFRLMLTALAASSFLPITFPCASALAQLSPPMVKISKPIGAAPGDSVSLEVRGSDFRDGALLQFEDSRVRVDGIELGKADGNGLRTLKCRMAVPAEAGPGPLRFRVIGGGGVSNPGSLLVGRSIPTIAEVEPNDRLRKPQVVANPSAIEGMITPGDDVDVYAVAMRAGETLVAEAIAARAGSRLDAFVTILSPDGRELAANDDLFGRDAAAWATVPSTGLYLVAIQDANGRHRDGGIEQKMTRPYRLEVGRLTLVSAAFPAGARRGKGTDLRLRGTNLPGSGSARFDPAADSPLGDRPFAVQGPFGPSNALNLRVGDADELTETEPNGKAAEAPVVVVPVAINGTFASPDGEGGDLDVYRIKAPPGLEGDYSITAFAARVGSPADPVLASLDAKGDPQGEDDDLLGRDARIERRVDSKDGLLIAVRDYYGRGGERFTYRIEVEPVARGVTVAADLGHRTVPRSGVRVVPVTVERKGFDGQLTILAEGLPDGVASLPITLETGESQGFLAFSAGPEAPIGSFSPRLSARDVAASFRFRERGPLDEVPREGDQQKGPRETTIDADGPVLAVADPASIGLTGPPGPIAIGKGGQAEVTFAIERRPDAISRRVKVRLAAPGKALEGFEPIKEIDLAADASSVTFALKPRPGMKPVKIQCLAHAWVEGMPELLGVDSSPVILGVE
jgi:hypothetical protein